jgi:hypothetical protein
MATTSTKDTSKASTSSASATNLGADAHEAGPGFHGHAGYSSREDLEQRLASARGEVAPTVAAPLPPAQQ